MTYKFRAECIHDVLAFFEKNPDVVDSYTIEKGNIGPDCVVSFESRVCYDELCRRLRHLQDSHVMLETLRPIEQYTGERLDFKAPPHADALQNLPGV